MLNQVVSIVSSAFQLVYVVRMFQAFYMIILIFRDPWLAETRDPKILAGSISQALMLWVLGAIVGLFGAALGWYVLRDRETRPEWFVSASRSFAFTWMLFVPIGTVVGFFMLRWTGVGRQARDVK